MHVAATDNNPEDRNNFNQNVNMAAQNYNAAQLKKRTRVQKMAADKVQLYERLSQPRKRNPKVTSNSQNTNGSKESSNEKRRASGSQRGSVKQKAKRKAAGLGTEGADREQRTSVPMYAAAPTILSR